MVMFHVEHASGIFATPTGRRAGRIVSAGDGFSMFHVKHDG
jgi:hypothetical protein